MNIRIAQWVDSKIGIVICVGLHLLKTVTWIFRRKTIKKDAPVCEVLIVKFWGMGSIILTIPALALFKKKNPDAKITFVTLEQNRQICEMAKEIDRIETVDLSKGLLGFFRQAFRLVFRLRKVCFDVVFDLEFFTKFSAIFTYFLRAKKKVGFFDRISWRGRLHDIEIPFNNYWHVTDNFINALLNLREKLDYVPMPQLAFDGQQMDKVLGALSEKGIRPGEGKFLIVNSNAGEMSLLRKWPKRYFVELIDRLLDDARIKIALIGNNKERAYVEGLIGELSAKGPKVEGRLFNLAGLFSVKELASLLAKADLFIGNDSGPLHLAVGMGTPTISFFGPETPVLYGSLRETDKAFFKDFSCSPCINVYNNKSPVCRHKTNVCLEMISPEEVCREVTERLKEDELQHMCRG